MDPGLCCFSIFIVLFLFYIAWHIFRSKMPPGYEPPYEGEDESWTAGRCEEHNKPLRYCERCVAHMKRC